MKTSLNTINLC